MLSGCPFLENLILEACNKASDLNIVVDRANWHLKALQIRDKNNPPKFGCKLLISAPSITTLVLQGYMRRYYVMKNMPSLVTASLDFRFMLSREVVFDDYQLLAALLLDLRHVQVLQLCSWCVQALSAGAFKSSRFQVDFSVTRLELAVDFMTCELPGIFHALRSFTKLEFLTIEVIYKSQINIFKDATSQENYVDERENVTSLERSPNMLQHLKTINIYGLVGAICAVEENGSVEEILEKYQNGFEFIQFLLKNSPVLKRLMINAPRTANKHLSVLFTFALRLLALPRASPDALVIIQDKLITAPNSLPSNASFGVHVFEHPLC